MGHYQASAELKFADEPFDSVLLERGESYKVYFGRAQRLD